MSRTNVKSGLPSPTNAFPDQALPEGLEEYVRENISITDGSDTYDRRWKELDNGKEDSAFRHLHDTDRISFRALSFATQFKTDIKRTLTGYKSLLAETFKQLDNAGKKENATILATALNFRTHMSKEMSGALDELEESGTFSDQTIKDLHLLGENAAFIVHTMQQKIADHLNRIPDINSPDENAQEKHRGNWYYTFMHLRNRKIDPSIMGMNVDKEKEAQTPVSEEEYRAKAVAHAYKHARSEPFAYGIKHDITHNGETRDAPDRPMELLNLLDDAYLSKIPKLLTSRQDTPSLEHTLQPWLGN